MIGLLSCEDGKESSKFDHLHPIYLVCSDSFFFIAEDGIRDRTVTGVQTCALPIWIVCCVGPGDKLAAGERFGMIRFGSRTDCCMPRGTGIQVRAGDRVTGGVSVLGVLS